MHSFESEVVFQIWLETPHGTVDLTGSRTAQRYFEALSNNL